MSVRNALLVVLSVVVLGTLPQPVSARVVASIHLVVRVDPPRFGDQNDLIYQVVVTNLGPDPATTLVARQAVLLCPSPATPLPACQRDPGLVFRMGDIARGAHATFAVSVLLHTIQPVVVRNTVEMLKAGQRDVASTLGTCRDGSHPQDACGTRVTALP